MRIIKGLALGAYYAKGASSARTTPHATEMRGLVYAVKDNRDPPNPRQPVDIRRIPPASACWSIARTRSST